MSKIFILILLIIYFSLFFLLYFYIREPFKSEPQHRSSKRIAIVLSGRINTDQKQYENFKKQFEKCNVDIFVSHSKGYSKEVIHKFIEWYKPKMIQESDETYIIKPECKENTPSNVHNVMCMFKNRYNALELLKQYEKIHSFQYDIIVSTRCDLFLNSDPIDFETFSSEQIHIPQPEYDYSGINDQFAFGNNKDMKVYLNVFPNIQKLCDKKIVLHPETLLFNHLSNNKIQINRFHMSYHLNRDLKDKK